MNALAADEQAFDASDRVNLIRDRWHHLPKSLRIFGLV
jgi:hypothetical protein